MILWGVVVALETPYGDCVIDVRGVTKRYDKKIAAGLLYVLVRREA